MTEMTDEEKRRTGVGDQKQGLAEPYNKVHHYLTVISSKGGVGKLLISSLLTLSL